MYHSKLEPKLCDKVSFGIGRGWREFGRRLNFSETLLDHIELDHQKTQDRAMAVLHKWVQKEGDPSWEQLKKVLADWQRNDIIIAVEKEFPLASITHPGIKT